MKSTQSHTFNQTKKAEIPRSSFDLSHGLKTTFDAGFLIPILSLEVLPGDTINCRASLFGRLATPIKPVLDNLHLETFFFFTPYRQIWDNWVRFNGEQDNPGDSTDFVVPILTSSNTVQEGSLYDYLGVPPGTDIDLVPISALPGRAYSHIYDNWFRDQNIIPGLTKNRGDGPDPAADHSIQRRRKRRDYLTSVLPWPQKGPEITVNLGGMADVIGDSSTNAFVSVLDQNTGLPSALEADTLAANHVKIGSDQALYSPLMADLGTATGISINDLRESFQIQKLLERDARAGTRYPEVLRAHFGVTDPAMLVHQRPLFLGGGHSMINVTPVQQNTPQFSETAADQTPQGNLAAFGTVSGNNHGFTYSATEHGHIIGIVNVRADLTYQQGLERYWSRQTRFDFYWPALSHLGEQAVLNKEIYISNDPVIDAQVFGYIPRYDEYRFKQSQITGLFRSSAAASLDVWHLAQDFATLPALNRAFIEETPPLDRVVAVPAEPDMLLDVYFKIRAARPLPLFATPGLIDHF